MCAGIRCKAQGSYERGETHVDRLLSISYRTKIGRKDAGAINAFILPSIWQKMLAGRRISALFEIKRIVRRRSGCRWNIQGPLSLGGQWEQWIIEERSRMEELSVSRFRIRPFSLFRISFHEGQKIELFEFLCKSSPTQGEGRTYRMSCS